MCRDCWLVRYLSCDYVWLLDRGPNHRALDRYQVTGWKKKPWEALQLKHAAPVSHTNDTELRLPCLRKSGTGLTLMWLSFWFYCFLCSSSGCFATAAPAVASHPPVCHQYDSCCPVCLVKKVQRHCASLRFFNKQVGCWTVSLKKNWRAPDGIVFFSSHTVFWLGEKKIFSTLMPLL